MFKKHSNNEFIEKVNQINQTIDLSGFNYINSKIKGLCRCKICNHEWYTVSSVLLSGSGCPKCKESISESELPTNSKADWMGFKGHRLT